MDCLASSIAINPSHCPPVGDTAIDLGDIVPPEPVIVHANLQETMSQTFKIPTKSGCPFATTNGLTSHRAPTTKLQLTSRGAVWLENHVDSGGQRDRVVDSIGRGTVSICYSISLPLKN